MDGEKSSFRLAGSDLMGLAPLNLKNHRDDRFRGDSSRSHLSEYGEADQQLLRQIYQVLVDLFQEIRTGHDDNRHIGKVLNGYSPQRNFLFTGLRRLGGSTLKTNANRRLAQSLHDVRGGALQSLLFRWEMFELLPDASAGLSAFFFLLRDQLKIMRCCIADLDGERFAEDSNRQDHGTELLLEKWASAAFYGGSIPAQIHFDCQYTGTLCESCLEFSTLERIIYNLINNAARNADDHEVQFHILPVPEQATAENLRFVIANHVSDEHAAKLSAAAPDLAQLFHSGFTTGGHGVGMSIVADFCAQAFGIYNHEKAVSDRYYGAKWIGQHFVTWFHWPVSGA